MRMLFTTGNLITLGIVLVVLLVYRQLDRDNRTLEKVKKFADRQRDAFRLCGQKGRGLTALRHRSRRQAEGRQGGSRPHPGGPGRHSREGRGDRRHREAPRRVRHGPGAPEGHDRRVEENLLRIHQESEFVDSAAKRVEAAQRSSSRSSARCRPSGRASPRTRAPRSSCSRPRSSPTWASASPSWARPPTRPEQRPQAAASASSGPASLRARARARPRKGQGRGREARGPRLREAQGGHRRQGREAQGAHRGALRPACRPRQGEDDRDPEPHQGLQGRMAVRGRRPARARKERGRGGGFRPRLGLGQDQGQLESRLDGDAEALESRLDGDAKALESRLAATTASLNASLAEGASSLKRGLDAASSSLGAELKSSSEGLRAQLADAKGELDSFRARWKSEAAELLSTRLAEAEALAAPLRSSLAEVEARIGASARGRKSSSLASGKNGRQRPKGSFPRSAKTSPRPRPVCAPA